MGTAAGAGLRCGPTYRAACWRSDHDADSKLVAGQFSDGVDSIRFCSFDLRAAEGADFLSEYVCPAESSDGLQHSGATDLCDRPIAGCSREYRIRLLRFQNDLEALTPGNVQLLTISGIAKNFANGYMGSWTAGVDHDFGDFKFNASYVATAGIHLARFYNTNGYGGACQGFAPFTQFSSPCHATGGFGPETIMSSGSHSSYHSLQTSLTKNSARLGLGLQASYTYSKALDDTSSVLGGLLGASGTILQAAPQNPWDPSAEKGPSTFDVTHVFAASVIQLLPLDRVGFLRPLGQDADEGLAVSEHHDPDDRIAVHRVFGSATDGRRSRRRRSSGSGFDAAYSQPAARCATIISVSGLSATDRSSTFRSTFPVGLVPTAAASARWGGIRFAGRDITTSTSR